MTEATKTCPMCGETIMAVAKKCRYCAHFFDPADRPRAQRPSGLDSMMMPVGRPTSAIVAGYMGLLALFPLVGVVFGLIGVVSGIVALQKIGREPELRGRGRAWFGIIVGGLMLLVQGAVVVILIIEESR